jgi:acyl-CoA synthetase (AMP-forming)/AMP-acid ligase II
MGVSVPFAGPDATGLDVALIDPNAGRRVTYGELEDRVGDVAAAIRAVGGARAVVACEMTRSLDDVIW